MKLHFNIVDRLLAYQAQAHSEQWWPADGGEPAGAPALVPVCVLALGDFLIDTDRAKCGSLVQTYGTQHVTVGAAHGAAPAIAERLEALSGMTMVQLPLAPKELKSEPSDAEKWAFLLFSSQDFDYESLPEPLRAAPFLAAASSARLGAMTPLERDTLRAELSSDIEWGWKDDRVAKPEEERRAVEEQRRAIQEQTRATVAATAKLRAEIEALKQTQAASQTQLNAMVRQDHDWETRTSAASAARSARGSRRRGDGR